AHPVFLLAGVSVLAGCTGDLSALDPAGPSAEAIATLWWIMFWGATAIFLATTAVLVIALTKPQALGRNVPRTLILWGGLILPSVILAALIFSSLVLGERLIRLSGSAPLRIEAVGER